jgi:hypothetical protein
VSAASPSDTNDVQRRWLADLGAQGYLTAVCKGWNAAVVVIEGYLKRMPA